MSGTRPLLSVNASSAPRTRLATAPHWGEVEQVATPRGSRHPALDAPLNMPCHIVCLTFDFDTQSGFIARGMTTPTPLSRGEFGLVGARRILALLKSQNIRATWFVPGFTIESHPKACEAVVEHGHEVAHHSWAHIPPAQQSREEEEADLVRANDAIARL